MNKRLFLGLALDQAHSINLKEEITMEAPSLNYSAMFTAEAVDHMGDSVVEAIFEGHDQVKIDADEIISKFTDTLTPEEYRGFNRAEAEKVLFAGLAEIKKEHGWRDQAEILATLNASVAEKSAEKWQRLDTLHIDHPDNDYLERKGVMAVNVRADGEKLVVPLRDIDGKLWSLQSISSKEGAPEFFEDGGLKKGNFSVFSLDPKAFDVAFQGGEAGWTAANFDPLASHKPSQPLLVAEGYATAATIGEATKETVVVAFDSGNIDPVVEALKSRFPMAPIFICADNDRQQVNNVGVEKAWEAAEKHQVGIVVPEFSEGQKGSNFNDLAAANGGNGKNHVADQIKPHIEGTMRKSREVVAAKSGFSMQPVKTCSKPVSKDRGVER